MNRDCDFYAEGKRLAERLRECCKPGASVDAGALTEAAQYIDKAADWVKALAYDEYPAPEVKKKKPVKQSKPEKHRYGEFKNVLLTGEELDKLRERFTDADARIDNLSMYIACKGAKYSSHYAVILNWARRDGEKKAAERGGGAEAAPSFETDEFFELALRRGQKLLEENIKKVDQNRSKG